MFHNTRWANIFRLLQHPHTSSEVVNSRFTGPHDVRVTFPKEIWDHNLQNLLPNLLWGPCLHSSCDCKVRTAKNYVENLNSETFTARNGPVT
jgi:hypothetical protein